MRRTTMGLPLVLGAAGLAYAVWETHQFTLRWVDVPVLEPGRTEIRLLHLSDLHITPNQADKIEWVRGLASLEPDLVVDTGDNLAHLQAVPAALDALGPLLQFPGAFVMGSNDYYAPTPKNPARYLFQGRDRAISGLPLPWRDLREGLMHGGWVDLDNARSVVKVGSRAVELVGVDDPHIGLDRYPQVQAAPATDADLVIGVTHAPYARVLDPMARDGIPLILAGHTHGGQLRLPGVGALVTNCDLPVGAARGLSRHGASLLHVSAGLGTSPYAPVRFACRPEATLLTLVPRS